LSAFPEGATLFPLRRAGAPGGHVMSLAEALEGLDISPRKREILDQNHTYLMPNRVELWAGAGVPLVIGRREGYRFWDVDGLRSI
jgi:hypothetical protein